MTKKIISAYKILNLSRILFSVLSVYREVLFCALYSRNSSFLFKDMDEVQFCT